MDANFKPQGSFGIPPHMVKQMDEARKDMAKKAKAQVSGVPKSAMPEAPDSPEAAEAPAPAQAPQQEAEAALKEKQFLEIRKNLEEALGVEITEDDVKQYIFKGRLAKEVTLVPGMIKATFQTLNPTEFMEIDEKVAKFVGEGKNTQNGVDNQKAILNLAYAWTHADAKPLTSKNDPEKRESIIRSMGAHLVDIAASRLSEFNALVRLVLQEKNFIKKS